MTYEEIQQAKKLFKDRLLEEVEARKQGLRPPVDPDEPSYLKHHRPLKPGELKSPNRRLLIGFSADSRGPTFQIKQIDYKVFLQDTEKYWNDIYEYIEAKGGIISNEEIESLVQAYSQSISQNKSSS